MRFLFQGGGRTGVADIESLADALSSRPDANTGDLFVELVPGGGESSTQI